MKSLPGRSNPHGEHATFPHLPCGEGFQGSLSLQCLEIVVCTAWEHYKGKTLLELDIMNSTSKVILCSGGGDHEAHVLQGDPTRLQSYKRYNLIIVILWQMRI